MTVNPDAEPLFRRQWYLENIGQTGGTRGMDINVRPAWRLATGDGIAVAVNDTGVSRAARNLDASVGGNFISQSPASGVGPDPSFSAPWHGTAVASLIAADDDGSGLVGAAPDATLASLVGLGSAGALDRYDAFDVVNASWGVPRLFADDFNRPAFQHFETAIRDAAETGRGGRGTAMVLAAGNDFTDRGAFGFQETGVGDANYHNFQNTRFTLPVAALDDDGTFSAPGNPAGFTTPGAPVLVSAPGTRVVTADLIGDLGKDSGATTVVQGTSFAAPLVSGVVALMLDANPDLGWRDVQEILAFTARRNDPDQPAWEVNAAGHWNGGGLHTNPTYGFGLVDAAAAVRLAETWRETDTSANEATVSATHDGGARISDRLPAVEQTVTLPRGIDLETVAVDIDLRHAKFGDVTITLTSPGGTTSTLVRQPDGGDFGRFDRDGYRLTSNAFYGESSGGTWTLRVSDDSSTFLTATDGRLEDWTLTGYGSRDGADDTYVYTDEYAGLAAEAPARQQLRDARGSDTLNAAAVSSEVTLDLAPGATSVIGGEPVQLGDATQLEGAFGGGGTDLIKGNAVANRLDGGPGGDRIEGRAGDDTLLGGRGDDTLIGGTGQDTVRLDVARQAVTFTRAADGTVRASHNGQTDTLQNIAAVSFSDGTNAALDTLLPGNGTESNPAPSATPNLLVLGGEPQTLTVPFTADVRTTAAPETVEVAAGATVAVAAGTGDGLRLPGALETYSVTASGNQLELSRGETVARVALNGSVDIGFDGGVATAAIRVADGRPEIRLGGEAVGPGFQPSAVALRPGSPGTAGEDAHGSGNLLVANGESQTLAVPFAAEVRSTAAAETVQVPATGDVTVAVGEGDEVEFAGDLAAYDFTAGGNTLTVARDGGARARIALNGEVELDFADGSAVAAIQSGPEGFVVALGGEPVDADFVPGNVALDTADTAALADETPDNDVPDRPLTGGDLGPTNAADALDVV